MPDSKELPHVSQHLIKPNVYLIVSVDVSKLPLVTRHPHSLVLCRQVDELPAFLPLLVILFGVVGECIQFLIGHCVEEKRVRFKLYQKQWIFTVSSSHFSYLLGLRLFTCHTVIAAYTLYIIEHILKTGQISQQTVSRFCLPTDTPS